MKCKCFGIFVAVSLVFGPAIGWSDILITANEVQMIPPAVTDFFSMEARIVGAEGQVYHATSYGKPLYWECTDCADGGYTVETRTAVEFGEPTEEKNKLLPNLRVLKTESKRFEVNGGLLTPSPELESEQSRIDDPAPLWQQLVTAMLDWLVPDANAVDLTATSDFPAVFFDDTGSAYAGNDFVLYATGNDSSAQTNHFFRLFDYENTRSIFNFTSTAGTVYMGIGTTAPSESLHIATPQTPAILLDSTTTDFRIGVSDDVTFRLAANPGGTGGVVGNVLTIENDLTTSLYPGLGIWQNDPAAPLHVGSHDSKSAKIIVKNDVIPTVAGDVRLLELTNPGTKVLRFSLKANNQEWTFDNDPNVNSAAGAHAGLFRITKAGTGVVEFGVDGYGNGVFYGTSTATNHVNSSSRELKTGFTPVDTKAVLEQLVALPITTWHFRSEEPKATHIGPVAEDFQAIFGMGDGRHLSTVDTSGVAFAAIQGLQRSQEERNQALEQQLREKDKQIGELNERLTALETLVLSARNMTVAKR